MSEESNTQADLLDFSDNTNANQLEENNLIGDILDQIAPSAPPAPASDDFIVVNGDKASSSNSSDTQEETNKMLLDLANSIQDSLKVDKIIAAADSPSSVVAEPKPEPAPKAKTPTEPKAGQVAKDQGSCSICPYYALGE